MINCNKKNVFLIGKTFKTGGKSLAVVDRNHDDDDDDDPFSLLLCIQQCVPATVRLRSSWTSIIRPVATLTRCIYNSLCVLLTAFISATNNRQGCRKISVSKTEMCFPPNGCYLMPLRDSEIDKSAIILVWCDKIFENKSQFSGNS